ncbi:hypothetical protein CK203_029248 [Vitis vinifera]|uniref:Uncharacterized protein n=1 Tax=Vitis vinifera TaxID=29760 RepID=A0A438DY33_VITVI|nr:hypothetical protein CK203_114847 [Vitis vinifera]RVW99806.1 hypothetical protein CK203_029248 [Vitis vinifera]
MFKPIRERWLVISQVKPRPLQKGDLVLRILRGLVGDPRGSSNLVGVALCYSRVDSEGAAWMGGHHFD